MFKSVALFAALVAAGAAQAQITVGAHLYTYHTNAAMHDNTPGIYAVWPVGVAGGKLITGLYRNSLDDVGGGRRISFYAGQVWEWGRFGVMAGLVSGYQRKTSWGDQFCPDDGKRYSACFRNVGFTSAVLAPLVAPSISFPEAREFIGVTPRLTLLAGKHTAAVHLSVERSF